MIDADDARVLLVLDTPIANCCCCFCGEPQELLQVHADVHQGTRGFRSESQSPSPLQQRVRLGT